MGPKKAAGSKSPSKSNNQSPVKKTAQTCTQPNAQTAQTATAEPTTEPAPAQPTLKPFTFKGHPQPPVDERLFAAKNFLADEDPNRCLEFKTKIAQIEEFIAQLEKDNVPCDAELFRDVKIKVRIHRDWEARLKTSPFDTGCCEALLIPPYSTRLVSAETAACLRQEREAQGLVTQMRTDHAPFTVDPEEDHGAFLAKLREDASTDPDGIDQATNLLWTESRAYFWAMRDPALIQYWMHPTQGIPTKGIRAGDASNRPQEPVSEAVRSRPARGWIGEVNFTPKAERRGIRRAAIELALNLLGTNQEQHRSNDRFRIVDLPLPIQRPEKEVPLCLPLLPEDRPLEMDPFEYTRKMLAFRQWKDFDYGLARNRTNYDRGGLLPASDNYKGPVSIASVNEFHRATRDELNNLGAIKAMMIAAVESAPRPLLQQLLLLVDAGLHHDTQSHPLCDDQRLTEDDIGLLEAISADSWDDEACEYGDEIPGLLNTPDELGRLQEFETDIVELSELPLWLPAPRSKMSGTDTDANELFTQIQYDASVPSTRWITANEVRQVTGNNRMAKTDGSAGTPHLWDLNSVTKYLKAMASAGRIHLDDLPGGQIGVCRIPFSGHPENKYVISRADAPYSVAIRRDEEGKLEVQYDAVGNFGPPIVQSNKYHHFQQIAFRLGRDLKSHMTVLAQPDPEMNVRVQQQLEARAEAEAEMKNITLEDRSEDLEIDPPLVRDVTLERMAQNLHMIAPELAEEAGFTIESPSQITERQAATLIQMQILDEASNNWEFKFPENEHVWDFAANRLKKTTRTIHGRTVQVQPRLSQYFHMRRYPPCCQSDMTKTAIKESGPTVQEQLESEVEPISDLAATMGGGQQKARHIKGREPYFSLGESAYEKAFLSWRMDQELKDVPEFQTKKPGGWFSKFRNQKEDDGYGDTTDRYPLPKIPSSWIPDNVSIADKRAQVLDLAKKTPAFPDPNILEYYHTPAEIEQIKLRREWDLYAFKREVSQKKVEEHTKRKYKSLTPEEVWKANATLGINPATGVFINDPPAKKGKGGAAKLQQSAAARRQSGPARNTRSKGGASMTMSGGLGEAGTSGKRTASGSGMGQESPKRFKVI